MSIYVHSINLLKSANNFGRQDIVRMGLLLGVVTPVGSGAGAAISVAVTGNFPPAYKVEVAPTQDCTWWITAKTAAGFTLNLAPRLAASTLAAGTVDLSILA